MITAKKALDRLREGNRRFVASIQHGGSPLGHSRHLSLIQDQHPFAIILGCSDSRVPAELVFNQGLGDLFVIRVAGNIVAPSQVGSVEFAASRFGTRLVVVLGHTKCGAIHATAEELQHPEASQSPNLRSIVDRVRPSMEKLFHEYRHDLKTLIPLAVRANVSYSVQQLRAGSPILEKLMQTDGLRVVGAEYSVETGTVEFFDGLETIGGHDSGGQVVPPPIRRPSQP